jgi:cell division protein FtsW (lipid II flippase)
MREATKKTLRDLGYVAIGFAIFTVIAVYVPDDALFKKIFGVFCGLILLGSIIWFSPLSNPIRRWLYKKSKEKKD